MPEPTSSDHAALPDLATAVEGRPRRPGDFDDPDIPVAATVVLVRDGAAGLEVLMIERPDRGSFAGAWVFPGGKIDPEDAGPVEDASAPEEADARRAAVRETWEETGLVVTASDLVTLSCWDPPPGIALRIRTWFFVAAAPEGELTLEPGEAVASAWVRPAEVLERHARGEMVLYPPTWVTLHNLTEQPDVHATLAATRMAGAHMFASQARRGPSGPVMYWQEDAEYEADRPGDDSGPRHRLEVGAQPWVYTRRD